MSKLVEQGAAEDEISCGAQLIARQVRDLDLHRVELQMLGTAEMSRSKPVGSAARVMVVQHELRAVCFPSHPPQRS